MCLPKNERPEDEILWIHHYDRWGARTEESHRVAFTITKVRSYNIPGFYGIKKDTFRVETAKPHDWLFANFKQARLFALNTIEAEDYASIQVEGDR